MFQVTGIKDSRQITLTWKAGAISGSAGDDAETFHEFLRESEELGPPTGPTTHTPADHLRSPLSCLIAMRDWFDEVIEERGNLPSPPPVPPGAVA